MGSFCLPSPHIDHKQRLKRYAKNIPYLNPRYICTLTVCSVGGTTGMAGQICSAVTPLPLLTLGLQDEVLLAPALHLWPYKFVLQSYMFNVLQSSSLSLQELWQEMRGVLSSDQRC